MFSLSTIKKPGYYCPICGLEAKEIHAFLLHLSTKHPGVGIATLYDALAKHRLVRMGEC